MAYEIYKTIKEYDEFFEGRGDLKESSKKDIYNKYVTKCIVLQRDKFTCQNENCPYCNNKQEYPNLTMHHIKFVKNNGEDKVRNCVTVCDLAHKEFHRGNDVLTINGKTYQIHVEDKINWKKIIKENKKLRKQLKYSLKKEKYSADLIRTLMKFLTTHYKDLKGE